MNTSTSPTPEWAAVYGRVSTDVQGTSLDAQDQQSLAYIRTKPDKLKTIAEMLFMDEGISGGVPMRKRVGGRKKVKDLGGAPSPWRGRGGEALFQALTNGVTLPGQTLATPPVKIQHLVISKVDRLGRDLLDGLEVWNWCKAHGVTIHIVDLGGDSLVSSGPMGKFMFAMLCAFAEWERECIRSRVTAEMRRKFERQECIGTCPYGYDLVGTGQINPKTEHELMRLEDNLGEQLWVRKMAGWRAQGMGWGKIATTLNSLGVPTKTRQSPWQAGNVKGVLESRHTARLLATAEPGTLGAEPPMNADEPQERKAA